MAKRLQSLGALTHGDRRATESRDLSKYNVDTKYGRQALEKTLRTIVGLEAPNVKMEDYPKDFFEREFWGALSWVKAQEGMLQDLYYDCLNGPIRLIYSRLISSTFT